MKITLLSEESIRVEGSGGPLTIEAPTADTIYSPFHMLASSLAVCTHSILMSWATNANIPTDGLSIDIEWTFAEKPHRVGEIELTFEWPGLPRDRLETARRVATLCPIHGTLHHSPVVSIGVRAADAAAENALHEHDHHHHHHA
jgi:uncharacterized OsmC-like protein